MIFWYIDAFLYLLRMLRMLRVLRVPCLFLGELSCFKPAKKLDSDVYVARRISKYPLNWSRYKSNNRAQPYCANHERAVNRWALAPPNPTQPPPVYDCAKPSHAVSMALLTFSSPGKFLSPCPSKQCPSGKSLCLAGTANGRHREGQIPAIPSLPP